MLEDVPMSMVPMASAGRGFGLTPRAIESVIDLAGLVHQTNYWSRGLLNFLPPAVTMATALSFSARRLRSTVSWKRLPDDVPIFLRSRIG
jgi:hypothetical protein